MQYYEENKLVSKLTRKLYEYSYSNEDLPKILLLGEIHSKVLYYLDVHGTR